MKYKTTLALVALLITTAFSFANIVKPDHYFNDRVGIISPSVAASLNEELANYEKQTSNQVVVVIEHNFDGALEETTQRLTHEWKVGQKDKNNGVVLFWFTDPHKIRLEVGYGLEGAIPDAIAKRITSDEMVPAFKAKEWDKGISNGVHSILKAARGEYKGTGHTAGEEQPVDLGLSPWIILLIILVIVVVIIIAAACSDGSSGGGFSGGGGDFGGGGGDFGGGGSSDSY